VLAIQSAARNSAIIFAQRRHRGRATAGRSTGFTRTIGSVRVFDKVGYFSISASHYNRITQLTREGSSVSYAGTACRALLKMLMHPVEHAIPASAAGKMEQRICEAAKHTRESAVGIVFGRSGHRPINYEWAAHDRVAIDETPVTAVPTTVAIISHYEITIRRDYKTAAVDIVKKTRSPLRPQATVEKIAAGGRKVVAEGIRAQGIVDDVRLVERLAIDIDVLIDNSEAIAG